MKRLLLCAFALFLLLAAGCKKAEKEQIVFMPDSKTAQTVGGYKKEIIIKPAENKKAEIKYYFNKSTKKFHLENCRYKENCEGNFSLNKNELINDGYEPCKICKP